MNTLHYNVNETDDLQSITWTVYSAYILPMSLCIYIFSTQEHAKLCRKGNLFILLCISPPCAQSEGTNNTYLTTFFWWD